MRLRSAIRVEKRCRKRASQLEKAVVRVFFPSPRTRENMQIQAGARTHSSTFLRLALFPSHRHYRLYRCERARVPSSSYLARSCFGASLESAMRQRAAPHLRSPVSKTSPSLSGFYTPGAYEQRCCQVGESFSGALI